MVLGHVYLVWSRINVAEELLSTTDTGATGSTPNLRPELEPPVLGAWHPPQNSALGLSQSSNSGWVSVNFVLHDLALFHVVVICYDSFA